MTLDGDRVARALPNYEIGEEVGRGGWGVVLRARHRQLGREVAVKELPQAFAADPGVQHRFVTEARLLATLNHPHVVPIYDYVEGEGLCLLVMELLDGGTVWDRFTSTGVSADTACSIVLAACSGLQHAHQKGILHRDIKPDNMLFTASGTLKVSDFGIAKVVGGTASMATRTGEVLGTPAYMAPEQALGHELAPATDVYAVATVLYELLAGRLPFVDDGNAIALLYRHVHEEPVPLGDVAPGVPAALCDTVMRALAQAPEDRFASAEDFGVAVADAAGGAWGRGWVQRGGVEVMASGRIGERISQPMAPADADRPATDGPAQEAVPVATPPEKVRAPATVVESATREHDEGQGALAASPRDLVPVRDLVPPDTPPGDRAVAAVELPASRPPTRRRTRRTPILIGAAVVGLAIGVGAVALITRDESSSTPSASRPQSAEPQIAATVEIGQKADHVAAGDQGIWASDSSGHALARIDPTNNGVTRVALDGAPHSVAVGQGAVWATVDPGGLARVQPAADSGPAETTLVPVAMPLAEVGVGQGAVWATALDAGQLVRVDPSTRAVVATIPVGPSPDSVAAGEGAVWVANRTSPGTVTRVDPSTNRVVATISVGADPDGLAVGAGSVWSVSPGDGAVSRIDPATNTVVATIPVGNGAASLVVGEGAVWVSNPETGVVSRIDPTTDKVTATLNVGGRPESITTGSGSVWVVDTSSGHVIRIDTGSGSTS